MKCDICKDREATVHLTEVVNGSVNKLHLCEECAHDKSEEMQSHFGLTDLLTGLMDLGPSMPDGDMGQDIDVKCAGCGLTYFDFQRSGRLGCGQCYETFEGNLNGLLRKIHGSERHVGKMPFKNDEAVKDQEDLQRLKNELGELILSEEFEKAALVRDRVREMEEKLEG